MSLSLSCSCGAEFEVEETLAGQSVACPECQTPLRAPLLERTPLRTSGYAIASLVLALVGAFTLIGTLVAISFGLVALGNIRRHRDEMCGSGLAVLGIVLGAIFTALTVFACMNGELFHIEGEVRGRLLARKLEYPIALEIVDHRHGFRITRPSEKWGVGKPELLVDKGEEGAALLLANPSRDAYVSVTPVDARGETLGEFRQKMINHYQNRGTGGLGADGRPGLRIYEFKQQPSEGVFRRDDVEIGEIVFDGRVDGQAVTSLVQIFRRVGTGEAYVVRGWTSRRRYLQNQNELRKVLDSFRIL
jgi:hypothetical protein